MADGPVQISVGDLEVSLNRLLDNLEELGDAVCQVNLVKSRKHPTAQNTRYLSMTDTLAERFKEDIDTSLRQIIADALVDNAGLAPFGFQAFADGRLAVLPQQHFPEVQSWLSSFPAREAVQPFNGDENYLSKLNFINNELTFQDGSVLKVFRSATNARVVKRGLIAQIIDGSRYTEVSSPNVLVFDDIVDFFLWEGVLYISNYRKFESVLNFQSITRSIAETSFDTVVDMLPVSDADTLKTAIFQSKRSLNKLAGLGKKSHLPQLDISKIRALITEEGIPLKISGDGPDAKICVDATDKLQLQAYLHILDDDYVRSLLTDIRYIGIEKNLL